MTCIPAPYGNSTLLAEQAERERIEALYRLDILDSEAEPEFDELVSLAAAICGVPISLVSLIDVDRQWFKAAKGITVRETPRSVSFCNHAIQQSGLFVVEDAQVDSRFAENPLVTGELGLRFYAGFPLCASSGSAVGTLCVLDHEPRALTQEQQTALRVLANQVAARLELRARRRDLEMALHEKELAHAESRRIEQRFMRFMDSGPFLSYIKDAEGRLVYYNKPMADHFGVSRLDFLGKTDTDLWPPEIAQELRAHDTSVFQSGSLKITQERTRNDDESYTIWNSFKFPCTSDEGEALLGGVSIDITEQLAREEELVRVHKELQQANLLLQQLATTDALTGLAQRRAFDEHLSVAFREARAAARPLTLLMLDVDNFKWHNDTYGHQHGDLVLRRVADALSREVRRTDFIARYGGEEFAIVLPNTDAENAEVLASRLLEGVRLSSPEDCRVTISIGIGEVTLGVPGTSELIARADQALFEAKKAGKDRAVLWRPN